MKNPYKPTESELLFSQDIINSLVPGNSKKPAQQTHLTEKELNEMNELAEDAYDISGLEALNPNKPKKNNPLFKIENEYGELDALSECIDLIKKNKIPRDVKERILKIQENINSFDNYLLKVLAKYR